MTVLSNVDDIVERVQRATADTQRDLERAAAPTTLACRMRNPADPWTPTVVFVPEATTDTDVQRLIDLIPPNAGVRLLAAATDVRLADRVLQVDPGGATLLPTGLRLGIAHLREQIMADAELLLSHALFPDLDEDVAPDVDHRVASTLVRSEVRLRARGRRGAGICPRARRGAGRREGHRPSPLPRARRLPRAAS